MRVSAYAPTPPTAIPATASPRPFRTTANRNADGRAHLRGGRQVKLAHPVSYYFKNNIWITTSGVGWEPAIKFCMEVLGPERVLYAMDYPYQQSSDEVAAYDRMHLSPEHKKMLMQGNAERVFNFTPAPPPDVS